MATNAEGIVNKENLIAWSLEVEALFIEQVRYRECLWNIKSSFYLRKSTEYTL